MPGGRPTKLTPELQDKIVMVLRNGNYRKVACDFSGISYQTFRTWMIRGEDAQDDPMYAEFRAAVERAEAEAEVADLAIIRKAAREGGSWQAAAWVQERKHPERWGRKDRSQVEVTGADGGPIDVKTSSGVDEQSIAALALLLSRRREESRDPLRNPPTDQVEAGAQALGAGGPVTPDGPVVDVEAHQVQPGELSESMPKLYSFGDELPSSEAPTVEPADRHVEWDLDGAVDPDEEP